MIPKKQTHLVVAANTHEGMSGKNNEDRFGVAAFTLSEDIPKPSLFAIVADGIGGHQAGEIAAEIAVETISQAIADSDASDPLGVLEKAIIDAGQAIHLQSTKDLAQQGMGSTCVCTWVIGNRLYISSVGDSRIYLLRDGKILQITTDHTWVQEAIQYGIISPDQARGHPQSHIIRRYLGSKKPTEPDFRLRLHPEESDEDTLSNQGMILLPGDKLLLCSDGLTDLVEDDEIKNEILNNTPEDALQRLIDLANQRGGHDNITVLTVQVPDDKKPRVKKKPAPNKLLWIGGGFLALIALIGVVTIAFLAWRFTRPDITAIPTTSATSPVIIETSVAPTTVPDFTPTISPPTSEPTPQATYTPWPTSTPKP